MSYGLSTSTNNRDTETHFVISMKLERVKQLPARDRSVTTEAHLTFSAASEEEAYGKLRRAMGALAPEPVIAGNPYEPTPQSKPPLGERIEPAFTTRRTQDRGTVFETPLPND